MMNTGKEEKRKKYMEVIFVHRLGISCPEVVIGINGLVVTNAFA
jgi:hypothetical protein